MKRDADTHIRTKELIDNIKREVERLQDDVIYGHGSNKFKSLTGYPAGMNSTWYATGYNFPKSDS
jgi:hypothetical protein